MTDAQMTPERARELLGGATPGPWRADGEPWNRIVWSSEVNRVCFMAHSNGLNDDRDLATSELVALAPTLAAEVLALRAKDEAAQKLAEALQMISAEAKEDNSVMGRSVFKSLKTCGDVADIALAAYALTQKEAGK